MHHPPADRPPYNEAHIQCQGPDNREIRTLVDTGAGPNVLSYDVFKKMGYRDEDLQPSLFKLSMADSTDLATGIFSQPRRTDPRHAAASSLHRGQRARV